MQLVKIASAIVAVALTPSEGAENHAVKKALLSQQVANHLRGETSADDERKITPIGFNEEDYTYLTSIGFNITGPTLV